MSPDLGEVLKEINGKALADVHDPDGSRRRRSRPPASSSTASTSSSDDGSTMCGNWLHSGVLHRGRKHGRSAATPADDPWASACTTSWGFSWPANRRVMYNRASADADGKPWDPQRAGIQWNGTGVDGRRAGHQAGRAARHVRRVHHAARRAWARLFSAGLNDGPFPEHYEAVEAPIDEPAPPQGDVEPGRRSGSPRTRTSTARKEDFPIVCTTYRLTEHFHYWTQHHHDGKLNEIQPGFFVEMPGRAGQAEGHRQRRAGDR